MDNVNMQSPRTVSGWHTENVVIHEIQENIHRYKINAPAFIFEY